MKSAQIKAVISAVLKEAEPGTPINWESANLGGSGLFRFSYRNNEGVILQRKVEIEEKVKDWELLVSQNQLFPFKSLKDEDIQVEFKDNQISVGATKPFSLTLWKADKLDLSSLLSIREEAQGKFILNPEGWQQLCAAAQTAKQHLDSDKVLPVLRGVNLQWVENELYFTAVGTNSIANRSYSQPKKAGRKSSKRVETGNVTLPTKGIDLMNSFPASGGDITIHVTQTQSLIENNAVAIIVDLIEGKFPLLENFHPAKGDKALINKDDLIKALESLVKETKGALTPTEITLSCDAGQLTVQHKKEARKIAIQESKPFKATVKLLGDSLLAILRTITAAKVSLMFPTQENEKLVVHATDALYIVLGLVVETVKYVKEKIQEISEPPQAKVLEEETVEDGTKVVIKQVETPQSGEPPKDGSPQAVAKVVEQAKAVTSAAEEQKQKESDPERRDLLQQGIERLKSLFASVEETTDDEIRFAGAATVFWTAERLHLITFKLTKKSRVFIDWITEDVNPAPTIAPSADEKSSSKVVSMEQRKRK